MTFLGLFRCKQTFSQNVAKFRLIKGLLVPLPNTYEQWQLCPLFVSRPNTYEWVSKSPKCTNVAVKDFVGSIWIQTNIFHSKSRPNYTGLTPMKFSFRSKKKKKKKKKNIFHSKSRPNFTGLTPKKFSFGSKKKKKKKNVFFLKNDPRLPYLISLM